VPAPPTTPAVTDIFDTLTGGSGGGVPFPLSTSVGCGLFCYGGAAAGVLAVATSPAQAQQSARDRVVAKAIDAAPSLLPGGSGQGPGQSFNLFGGGGGGGVALMLLSLSALLGAKPVRALRWIQLRLPTEMWPPSAYVPPLESPG
jgi:hypothetical protein